MQWSFLIIPLACAITGWAVLKLTFSMIFRLLPAQQPKIATAVGNMVADRFFSMDMITEKIADPANFKKIMPMIDEHIDDFLRHKLKKEMPVVGMFIGDKMIESMKKVFMAELEILFPKLMRDYAANLGESLNIRELARQKIATIWVPEIKKAFYHQFSSKINLAALFAALLGLVIGTIAMFTVIWTK
jgi:uncharacterized membrane protein YheB (UPF0754 family)